MYIKDCNLICQLPRNQNPQKQGYNRKCTLSLDIQQKDMLMENQLHRAGTVRLREPQGISHYSVRIFST